MRRGVEVYKSDGEVSKQRLKRRGEAAVYLLCPPLTFFWRENEKSMMGRTKGELERKNGRMKVFIGVEGG
jgi:hypothetical protein